MYKQNIVAYLLWSQTLVVVVNNGQRACGTCKVSQHGPFVLQNLLTQC